MNVWYKLQQRVPLVPLISYITSSSEIIHLETSNATAKGQYPTSSKTGLHRSIQKISISKKKTSQTLLNGWKIFTAPHLEPNSCWDVAPLFTMACIVQCWKVSAMITERWPRYMMSAAKHKGVHCVGDLTLPRYTNKTTKTSVRKVGN